MNFLILAAGTRNKVVQYFRRAFDGVGTIVATDANKLGPAIYEADKYYIIVSVKYRLCQIHLYFNFINIFLLSLLHC